MNAGERKKSGKNEGNTTAEILIFYAGVLDTTITVKKKGATWRTTQLLGVAQVRPGTEERK